MGADTPVNTSGRLRRPTMRDVAARVGVSQTLVSLVFRNAPGASAETRERVFRAAAELGYRPDTAAQVLRRNRSRHIGVLFTMRQPFDVDLVEAIYPATERRCYHVVLGAIGAGRDDRQAVEELLAYRSEALILDGTTIKAAQLARVADQMPVIDSGRRVTGDSVDVVGVADQCGGRLRTDCTLSYGVSRVNTPSNPSRPPAASSSMTGICPRPSSRQTTDAPMASSTPSSVRTSTSPAIFPSWATTTAKSPGCPSSISPPSARTPH